MHTPPQTYTIGLDFGTNSVRALLVRIQDGVELASHVFNYPSGDLGVILCPSNPHLARQNPADYLQGMEVSIQEVLRQALLIKPDFEPAHVIGIGVDTTGSTVIPIGKNGRPLAFDPAFAEDLDAHVWLWKDHTAHAEAEEITRLSKKIRPQYVAQCGGRYSSEWWWSKILRIKRVNPRVYAAAETYVEHCDWIPAVLCELDHPKDWKRGICSAGHKAMFSTSWGGLPDQEFLNALEPGFGELRSRLYDEAYPATEAAGVLGEAWAQKLGLSPGIPVAVGAFDAHMGAVGAGIGLGVLVKILGTSTCDLMVSPVSDGVKEIPGVCGVVPGSVMPGMLGIEAGQSAVGDIFLSYVRHHVPDKWGADMEAKFIALEKAASRLKPGESGLLALDWHNGNRTILVDPLLSGLILGQTLHTTPDEIYRALIESTAFGARMIVERLELCGVLVSEVVNTGGLASKNPLLMQIYADVLGKPMKVSQSDQTCALGAAIFAAVVGKGHESLEMAQKSMCGIRESIYTPDEESKRIYDELFELYRDLHDSFGTSHGLRNLHLLMKKLIAIRDQVKRIKAVTRSAVG